MRRVCVVALMVGLVAGCGPAPNVAQNPAPSTSTSAPTITTTSAPTITTTPAPTVPPPSATASPTANAYGTGEIAYTDGAFVTILDLAGGATRDVARGVRVSDPAWAADGARLAFTDNTDIITINPVDGVRVPVTSGEQDELSPAFGPDGTLFFVRQVVAAEQPRIDIVRVDGAAETIVHSEPGGLCSPTDLQVADAQRVVLALTCGRGKNVLLIDLQSGQTQDLAETYLSATDGCAYAGRWSAQGRVLAALTSIECLPEQSSRLVLIDTEAKSMQLLLDDARAATIAWAPDGQALVFDRSRATGEAEGIWVLPAGGGEPRQISAVGREPAWRPAAP